MSFWSWFWQRITAVLLLFFLGLHLILEHFSFGSASPTFAWIAARLEHPVFLVVDVLFLAVVSFHGLNGLGNVILDFGMPARYARGLAVGLWLAGMTCFVLGLDIILPLAGYPAWFYW